MLSLDSSHFIQTTRVKYIFYYDSSFSNISLPVFSFSDFFNNCFLINYRNYAERTRIKLATFFSAKVYHTKNQSKIKTLGFFTIIGCFVTLSYHFVCVREKLLPNRKLIVHFHFTRRPTGKRNLYTTY